MKSMTGFGQERSNSKNGSLTVSVRAVNGRFLECRVHLPKEYQAFESEIRKMVGGELRRGTVDLYINRSQTGSSGQSRLNVDEKLAQEWVSAYKKLSQKIGLEAEPDFNTLVSSSGIFSLEEAADVGAAEKKLALKTVQGALAACNKERLREGASLKKLLGQMITGLKKKVDEIKKYREQANEQLAERFHKKIDALKVADQMDDQRIAQEIVIQLDKSDISEEIERLAEHLKRMKALLGQEGPIGKKLDFYTQELLREVNTIGSKSSVVELTSSVVDAKTMVEQIREQVQNVE